MQAKAMGEEPGFGLVLLTELRAIMARRDETPSDVGPFPTVDAEQAAWGRAVEAGQHARAQKLGGRAADRLSEQETREVWQAEQEALVEAWRQELTQAGQGPGPQTAGREKRAAERAAAVGAAEAAAEQAGPEQAEAAADLVTRARQDALEMDLLGLALSGGGIRSATFNLGVLQGLAELGLLKRLDYLSTVSGGGYIGSWLAAWVKREGNVRHVEKQLQPERWEQARGRPAARRQVVFEEEPEPVFHLRAYSNYLAPRPGLLSADSWVGASIYLRNLLLNQLLLLPALMGLLLLTRLALLFYEWEGGTWEYPTAAGQLRHWATLWYVLFGGAFVCSLGYAALNISRALEKLRATRRGGGPGRANLGTGKTALNWAILAPIVLAAFLSCWFAWDNPDPAQAPWLNDWLGEYAPWLLQIPSPYARAALVFAAVFALPFGLLHFGFAVRFRAGRRGWALGAGLAGFTAGAVGGAVLAVLLVFTQSLFHEGDWADMACEAATILTVGPPVALLVFMAAAFLQVGLLGRNLDEDAREWWASLCGRLLLIAAGWAAVCAISFFSVPLLLWAGPMVRMAVGAGWLTASLGGLLAARSPNTGGDRPGLPREFLAQAAPYVILVGLLVGLSYLLSAVVDRQPPPELAAARVPPQRTPAEAETPTTHTRTRPHAPAAAGQETETQTFTEAPNPTALALWRYWAGLLYTGYNPLEGPPPPAPGESPYLKKERWLLWAKCLVGLALCGLVLAVGSRCIDVNVFSLHGTYGNRLVRCYLGASRVKAAGQTDRLHGVQPNSADPKRNPDPITGFDPNDDFPLHDLAVGPRVPWGGPDMASRRMPYWGPYLLVNTAMNLVEGDELAWQERKAESFVLTPEFCGSKSTGYRPLPDYGRNLSLGTAVTVSGAAASPNMGYHSSPAVTALLTVFNVRLGAWLGNPRRDCWQQPGPYWSFGPLFQELFGRTDLHYKYLYLSDGGHFENLGAYELVRRRCRYIIVCDAGCDGDYAFDDLGDLIRKCRSDFGVPIEIDALPIRPHGEGGHSKWHCAVGKVRYDCVHPDSVPGLLIYLKASLSGDEPQDVLNYKAKHPDFPHQSTANQFFSESQFESYRALGQHVLESVFGDAMEGVDASAEMSDPVHRDIVRKLFANLHRRWFPPPPQLEEGYLESVQSCIDLEVALRQDKHLAHFSRTVYPESQAIAPAPSPPTPLPRSGGEGGDAPLSPEAGARGRGEGAPDADTEAEVRAEIHAVSQMLQVMEDAWLRVHLEGYNAHPMNRGWMNALRRWTSSEVFRKYWLLLRGEYSWDFVHFCESELSLDPGRATADPPNDLAALERSPGWKALREEFDAEWPTVGANGAAGGLDSLAKAAAELGAQFPAAGGKPALPLWVVKLAPQATVPDGVEPPPSYPCGVVLVWRPPGAQGDCELVAWLRGAYRNLGIGRQCLKDLLPRILQALQALPGGDERHLRVRFPGVARLGSGKRMQKEMWLRFFHQYEFHRNVSPGAAQAGDLVLELKYKAAFGGPVMAAGPGEQGCAGRDAAGGGG
jgi:hypothetical protein